jgi:hypothetical protein
MIIIIIKHLWKVGKFLRDYTAQCYSPPWEPEILKVLTISTCKRSSNGRLEKAVLLKNSRVSVISAFPGTCVFTMTNLWHIAQCRFVVVERWCKQYWPLKRRSTTTRLRSATSPECCHLHIRRHKKLKCTLQRTQYPTTGSYRESVQCNSSAYIITTCNTFQFYPSHLCLDIPNGPFPSGFQTITLYKLLVSSMRSTYSVHLNLLCLITQTINYEEYKLWNPS